MKISISKSPYAWICFGVLLYTYMTTYQTVLYGSRLGGVVVIISLVFIGCFLQLKKGKLKIEDRRLFWFALAIFSLFQNQDLQNGTESRWILPVCGIGLLFVFNGNDFWQESFVRLVRFFTGIHTFFTIFFYLFKGLYLKFFVKMIPEAGTYLIAKFTAGCMSGITSHYSTNGIYLGIGFVFFTSDLITHTYSSTKQRNVEIVKTCFVLLALILTTKRAHILFGGLACFVVYYVYNSNKKISRWFYMLSAAFGVLTLVLLMAPFVPAISRMFNRFLYADGGELTNGRIWFWEFALEQFKKSPIRGIGWGGFKHAFYQKIGTYASTSDYVDAHNVYLQLLCEQGIIGLGLFLSAVSSTFLKTWKLLKLSRIQKNSGIDWFQQKILGGSLGIQAFFIMYCATGNCLYDCEIFFVYMFCCVIPYNVADNLRRTKNE